MANEISVSCELKLNNDLLIDSRRASAIRSDQTTQASTGGIQTIATTAEAITYGDVTTPRQCYLRNLDDTNFVEVGIDVADTFYPLAKLYPSADPMLFTIADSVVLYAKADTASVTIDKLILDE